RPWPAFPDEARQDQQFEKRDVAVGGDGFGKRNVSVWRRDAIDLNNRQSWSLAVAMAKLRRELVNQPTIARITDAEGECVERAGRGGHVSPGEPDDWVAHRVALHRVFAPHTAANASAARHPAASRPIRQTIGRDTANRR